MIKGPLTLRQVLLGLLAAVTLGNAGLIWGYFELTPTGALTIVPQALIFLFFGWKMAYRAEKLAMVTASVCALSALLIVVVAFAAIYRSTGLAQSLQSGEVTYDPMACLYFSVVTITTLGYGDLVPTSHSRFPAAAEALLGYVLMAAMIAILGRAFTRFFQPAQNSSREPMEESDNLESKSSRSPN